MIVEMEISLTPLSKIVDHFASFMALTHIFGGPISNLNYNMTTTMLHANADLAILQDESLGVQKSAMELADTLDSCLTTMVSLISLRTGKGRLQVQNEIDLIDVSMEDPEPKTGDITPSDNKSAVITPDTGNETPVVDPGKESPTEEPKTVKVKTYFNKRDKKKKAAEQKQAATPAPKKEVLPPPEPTKTKRGSPRRPKGKHDDWEDPEEDKKKGKERKPKRQNNI